MVEQQQQSGPPLHLLGIITAPEPPPEPSEPRRLPRAPPSRLLLRASLTVLLLSLTFSQLLVSVESKRRHRDRLPIDGGGGMRGEDAGPAIMRGHKNKASECRFGDKRYGLEETWNPDLGPPFGVMHCVHCECVKFHKKRRIVGRVRCKNIKSECPAPNCPNPILKPGRCCKVCPGQENNPDDRIDVDLAREEEEKNGRHYATLMTRSTSLTPTASPASATGRFYFRKKTLSFSLVTSPDFGRPSTLTFLDSEQNIVEEFSLRMTQFQNATGKICGTWHRLPRRYRRQLRGDELHAQLTSEDGAHVVSGRIAKYYGLTSELFSGLLLREEPASENDVEGKAGAATAILSVSSSTGSSAGSVHTMLLLSGVFSPEEKENVIITVAFETFHAGERRVIEEQLKVASVDHKGVTSIDFKTIFDEITMTSLGHGQLVMSVVSKGSPHLKLTGYLVPKFSCDLFDSVLSALPADSSDDGAADLTSPVRGLAWFLMRKDGDIRYHVRVDGADAPTRNVTSITIDNGRKSRRLLRVVVDDLAPTFRDGWANGTLRLGAADVESLYSAGLFINVATEATERELRGRIVPQMMSDAHEDVRPVLMRGEGTAVTGLAWANMDDSCALNYQMRLTGAPPRGESDLVLKDFPMAKVSNLATMPGRTSPLETFRGGEAEGDVRIEHKLTIARLDAGDAVLVVEHGGKEPFTVQGRLEHIHPPEECLPRYARTELELMPGYLSDLGEERPEVERELATRCLYEGAIYEEGAQWGATHVKCQRCHCRRGKVICNAMVCPETSCAAPIIREGECCATCDADDARGGAARGCVYKGDQQFHAAGSRWHPYVPPFGFSRCVTCSCPADTLVVNCGKPDCPKLDCPRERQVRTDPTACCQTCAPAPPTPAPAPALPSDPERPHDMGRAHTDADRLASGGCGFKGAVFDNGEAWNPTVAPQGRIACVTCKCKDGDVTCSRRQCPALSCKYKVKDKNACCHRCAETKDEIRRARIRKVKKLQKRRRLQQQQQQQALRRASKH